MKTIKPKDIKEILDMTVAITKAGGEYHPCFAGDSGIGKSQLVQQWAKERKLKLLDLRLAYMEGPDLVGLPSHVEVNGVVRTIHALPDFLPIDGEGVIFFEEPNRAHESVMQTMMQVLTDGKIHNWVKPKGWIIAAAINPEGRYNVNTMDIAVKNRFAMYDVKFDQNAFVDFMKNKNFDGRLISFVESGQWVYKSPEEIAENAFYVSGRSIERLNYLLAAKVEESSLITEMMTSVVGPQFALDFYKYINEIRPITAEDFIKSKAKAMKRLREQCAKPDYKGDLTSVTVNSLIDAHKEGKIKTEILLDVANVIEKDQAMNLLTSAVSVANIEDVEKFVKKHKDLLKLFKERIKDIELT
jgi:hypothetical protein